MRIHPRLVAGGSALALLAGGVYLAYWLQSPHVTALDEKVLRQYAGVYQWAPDEFVYLQLWNEFAGTKQLVAFDESGEVRTLYPTAAGRFFSGPGAALATSVESQVEFQRDPSGRLVSLTWQRGRDSARAARRVETERHQDVSFANGAVQLAGTLISPSRTGKHPVIILVHGSGPGDRESMLPFARFLIRHGIAVLGYDKRGVGGSTGTWKTASFEDLAGDVVAAFDYLRTRSDIDASQIGLIGVSQAGWVMPIAAVRAPDLAFLISVSGAGVSAAESMLDHARNEMSAARMAPQTVDEVVSTMRLQIEFARTGRDWAAYAAKRGELAARLGRPPANFPATPEDPYWQFLRPLVTYDPGPTLRRLQVPTLALFGELDNNIVAPKNAAAWQAALEAGGHRDYTIETLPKANHIQLEAATGTNAEMASLRRFVPAYAATVHQWLAKRIRGFGSSAGSSSAF